MADTKAEEKAAEEKQAKADAKADAAAKKAEGEKLDETVEGGRYVVNGVEVNAEGEPI